MKIKTFILIMASFITTTVQAAVVVTVIPTTPTVVDPSSPSTIGGGGGTGPANPVLDPITGNPIILPQPGQTQSYLFFTTGVKNLKRGYYGPVKPGPLKLVEQTVQSNGTIVDIVCDINKKEKAGQEFLVINGVIQPSPICTYNETTHDENVFVRTTVFAGDKVAIWTRNTIARHHHVAIRIYDSNF